MRRVESVYLHARGGAQGAPQYERRRASLVAVVVVLLRDVHRIYEWMPVETREARVEGE